MVRDPLLRHERLAEGIRKELCDLLLTESKDPRLEGVVISAVELSRDHKLATAYFSLFGDAERERQAADGLAQATGFLRRRLRKRMRIHEPPQLDFRRDRGFERADRVDRILSQLDLGDGPPADGSDG